MPAMIEPSTATMSSSGGSNTTSTRSQSGRGSAPDAPASRPGGMLCGRRTVSVSNQAA